MAKHRTKKRNYRMINFKVYYDTDQDILDWWESIEAGERSDAVRDLIREQLGSVRRCCWRIDAGSIVGENREKERIRSKGYLS